MFSIRRTWRLLWGRCPACNTALHVRWQPSGDHGEPDRWLRFIEYCPERHFVCFDNDPALEFEDADADIEMTKHGL